MANEQVGGTNNKIAIITGGSRGLGRNTAIHLARRGVDIIFTYRADRKEAESLIHEIEAMRRKAAAFRLDAGNVISIDAFVADVRKTLETWGVNRFDYLVNNAGNSLHAAFTETTEAQFDEIGNVHFKGVYFLTQKLLPLMNDGGRIVNISSGLARFSIPGLCIRSCKRRDRGSHSLSRQRARAAQHHRQRGCSGRHSNRLQRRDGARQSGNQQDGRGHDGLGTGRRRR